MLYVPRREQRVTMETSLMAQEMFYGYLVVVLVLDDGSEERVIEDA
jgi:hypothetical protein